MQQTNTQLYHITEGKERQKFIKNLIFDSNSMLNPDEAYQRFMKQSESAWAFYRATNVIFWHDLTDNYLIKTFGKPENSAFWICGDAHFQNIGAFNKGNGIEYFLNDYDDAVIADFQYDIIRMTVALHMVGGRYAKQTVNAFLNSYFDTVFNDNFDINCRFTSDNLSPTLSTFIIEIENNKKFKRKKWLKKLTKKKDGQYHFRVKRKLQHPRKDAARNVKYMINEYASKKASKFPDDFFEVHSVSRRLEGLGSFLRDRYYVLIRGKQKAKKTKRKKLVVLDLKYQTTPSAFIKSCAIENATMQKAENHAMRTVNAQKAMEGNIGDIPGDIKLKNAFYSIRQANPIDEKFVLKPVKQAKCNYDVLNDMGKVMATAHMRSAKSLDKAFRAFIKETFADKETRSDYIEKVNDFSAQYATQVNADYQLWKNTADNIEEEIFLLKDTFSEVDYGTNAVAES